MGLRGNPLKPRDRLRDEVGFCWDASIPPGETAPTSIDVRRLTHAGPVASERAPLSRSK